jgi:hypothetical protein
MTWQNCVRWEDIKFCPCADMYIAAVTSFAVEQLVNVFDHDWGCVWDLQDAGPVLSLKRGSR